jgi:hypothetical protein
MPAADLASVKANTSRAGTATTNPWDTPDKRLIPQLIDQQQTRLEIAIEEHREDVAVWLHSSSITHELEEIVHGCSVQHILSGLGF